MRTELKRLCKLLGVNQSEVEKVKRHINLWDIDIKSRLEERKTIGYYYKYETKYPPRVYVFFDNLTWNDRNRRPMGLMGRLPFLEREMTEEEKAENLLHCRLQYEQYECWEQLLADERKIVGDEFADTLSSFRQKYPLKGNQKTIF